MLSFLSYAAAYWADVGRQAAEVGAVVADWAQGVAQRVGEALGWLAEAAAGVASQLGQAAGAALAWVAGTAGTLAETVARVVGDLFGPLAEGLVGVGRAAVDSLGEMAGQLLDKLRTAAMAVKAVLALTPGFAVASAALDALLDGTLANGLRSVGGELGKIGAAAAGLSAKLQVSLGSLKLWITRAAESKDALTLDPKKPLGGFQMPPQAVQFAAALERGSAAEYSVRMKAEFGGDWQKQSLDYLKQIAKNTAGKATAAALPAGLAAAAAAYGEV